MKKFLLLSVLGIVLVGCTSKEALKGKRQSIVLSEGSTSAIKGDNSPVTIDAAKPNDSCTQPFYNATHYYAPLKMSYKFRELWSAELDFSSTTSLRTTASPIITEGRVFCMDAGGIVYAIDSNTGKKLWRRSTTLEGKDGQIGGALAYADGLLIVNTSFSESIAFDATTGKIAWRVKLPAPAKGDAITIRDGKAFMLCMDSSLNVINIKTGKILWTHSGILSETEYLGSASVAIDNDAVYVVYPSGEIFALLLENGSVLWDAMVSKFSLTNTSETYVHPRACPVVKDNFLYVIAANGQTLAFDTRTGERIWTADCGSVQTPIVSGNSIFICSSNSELICLNRFNGHKRWVKVLDKDTKFVFNWYGQLLSENYIVTLSPHGRLRLVSPENGCIKRVVDIANSSDAISLNPVIANGIMYVQMNSGKVVAYK